MKFLILFKKCVKILMQFQLYYATCKTQGSCLIKPELNSSDRKVKRLVNIKCF